MTLPANQSSTNGPGTKMKIVFASHSQFNPRLVVGSHHLARSLGNAGHEVLHISTPITLGHLAQLRHLPYRERFANWRAGGRKVAPGVTDYVPLSLVPWQLARKSVSATCNLFVSSMLAFKATVRRFGFESPDLLLIDEPRLVGIQRLLNPARTYYRATDLYADFKNDPSIKVAERILAAEVDGVIGTSGPVLEWLQSIAPGSPSLLMENGVDYRHFSAPRTCPAEYQSLPRPRAVYIGALDDRFDSAAVQKLAEARPHVTVILIGPPDSPLPESLLSMSNVLLLGSRSYDRIPFYLQHADVGLLPLNNHAANRGRSPMKLYEYASAGLPVVSAATEEVVRRAEPFVFTYGDAGDIAAAVDAALGSRDARMRAREAARGRDWEQLTESLLRFGSSTRAMEAMAV
jgi:glycosyltransferase involved in cell wall biosynthesis